MALTPGLPGSRRPQSSSVLTVASSHGPSSSRSSVSVPKSYSCAVVLPIRVGVHFREAAPLPHGDAPDLWIAPPMGNHRGDVESMLCMSPSLHDAKSDELMGSAVRRHEAIPMQVFPEVSVASPDRSEQGAARPSAARWGPASLSSGVWLHRQCGPPAERRSRPCCPPSSTGR